MTTLCSEGYRQFYNALQAETVSAEDIVNLIPGALLNISDEMHLGKFEIRTEIPPSSADAVGLNDFRVLYESPLGFELLAHTRMFKSPAKGNVSFAVFPVAGYKWNEEEKSALDFLIKNMYVVLAKARVTEMLNMRQLTDYLTMLPNTTYFMKFSQELSIKGILNQYTVVFSNLKSFNYINQTFGSQAGDTVLKEYGSRLLNFYKQDEIIARFGGDNFVALLKNENVDNYLNYISKINITVVLDNQTRALGISARSGVYPIPAHINNIGEALSRSSASLVYAKQVCDSEVVWFRPEILERANNERQIISYFRTALTRKEFLVYYQPKVNSLTGKICGCEALVRWKRDDQIISPAGFVPVLEKEGLICDLDFYVLERVCENIRHWTGQGIVPARVSVNFSKLHLRNPHLIDDVINVIQKYRINPDFIEIELTESASSEDYMTLEKYINELREQGICISIDDFGTGYSSLSLLKDLNVDVIKIDKSFIDDITVKDSKDRVILSSIMSMVTGLGMEVIAEGCETAEQARILKDMNCTMIQGYLFDKPLPYEEYTDKLAGGHVYAVEL
ncbi:MAG: bifunctional diguanylate cyclase/phosphodiesterase [Lachnospiraceae bacterium]|nr:bifunctional diguanylate cyclase/phosphodiesterase [Lachnospiraceae bacterium]